MLNKKRTNKEETNNKKSVKSVKTNQIVSQDTNNNLQVTINRNSNTGKRRVLKTGSKKSNKLSVTFSNRKPIEPLYEDSQLSQIIDYYNEHLRQHNSIKTPKFSSDIIVCHKKQVARELNIRKTTTYFTTVSIQIEPYQNYGCIVLLN